MSIIAELEAWIEEKLRAFKAELLEEIRDLIGQGPPQPSPPGPPAPPAPPTPLPTTSGVIAVTNQDPGTPDIEVSTACAKTEDELPAFQKMWPHVGTWQVIFVPPNHSAPAGSIPAVVYTDLSQFGPDAEGALAFHTVDEAGRPSIAIGAQTIKEAARNGDASATLLSGLSHEVWELIVDPPCTLTATAPDGTVWALEDADPTESDLTPSGCSNAVGPPFFGRDDSAIWDLAGVVTVPFALRPGGYAVENGKIVQDERASDARKRHVAALHHLNPARRRH